MIAQFHSSVCCKRQGCEGIALIITIGILALLLIVAIGFSVTMRVERAAAKSFADSVRARLLLEAATARVMSDLNAFLADPGQPLMVYPNFNGSGSRIWSSPNFGPGGLGKVSSDMSDEALSFFPVDLTVNELDSTWKNAYWNEISDHNGNEIGEYAFLVVDCSGYLDASVAGGLSRLYGKDSKEIDLKDLNPEFNGSAQSFLTQRTNKWIRFESYPDLQVVGEDSGILAADPINLFPYSRFVPDARYDISSKTATNRIDIGGSAAELENNEAGIRAALVAAGVPNDDKVFLNLLDYVDTDLIPRDFNSFCTEPVPMINEIVVSNSVTRNDLNADTIPDQWVHDVYINVETWYPFVGNQKVQLTAAPPPFFFSSSIPSLNPGTANMVSAPASVDHSEFSYRTNAYHYRIVSSTSPGATSLRCQVNLGPNELKVALNGTDVDKIFDSVLNNDLMVEIRNINASPLGQPAWSTRPAAISCADPRLNHTRGSGGWATEPATLGRLNNNATGGEGVSPMYVRNNSLRSSKNASVAELGFLSIGKPWQTIALYNTPVATMNPVLDYFTMENNPVPVRGKVNVNTPKSQVLASVFNSLPVRPIPENPSNTVTLTWQKAQIMADAIVAKTASDPFENISEICNFDRNFFTTMLGVGTGITDADIEAVIRQSYELLGIRQNLFTVYLASRLRSETGKTMFENKAIAVIWRDPIPNSNGHHASFVRFYKQIVE